MIEAMKHALEALEAVRWSRHLEDARTIAKNARYSLRQAIAEAEQWDTSDMAHRSGGLSVEQAEKQEPVAYVSKEITTLGVVHKLNVPCFHYTAPPRKEWVGLTDEEVSEILDAEIGFNSCFGPEKSFARAIEAKLRERNNG
jgi:hypothetical protein